MGFLGSRAKYGIENCIFIHEGSDGDTGDWALGLGSERDFAAILLVVHDCFNYNHTRVLNMFSDRH